MLHTSGFVDDAMFARNGQAKAMLKVTRQGAAPGRSLMPTIALTVKSEMCRRWRRQHVSDNCSYSVYST